MLGSVSFDSSGHPSVKCAGSLHTAHADEGRDGNAGKDDWVSVIGNKVARALTDSTDGDFD